MSRYKHLPSLSLPSACHASIPDPLILYELQSLAVPSSFLALPCFRSCTKDQEIASKLHQKWIYLTQLSSCAFQFRFPLHFTVSQRLQSLRGTYPPVLQKGFAKIIASLREDEDLYRVVRMMRSNLVVSRTSFPIHSVNSFPIPILNPPYDEEFLCLMLVLGGFLVEDGFNVFAARRENLVVRENLGREHLHLHLGLDDEIRSSHFLSNLTAQQTLPTFNSPNVEAIDLSFFHDSNHRVLFPRLPFHQCAFKIIDMIKNFTKKDDFPEKLSEILDHLDLGTHVSCACHESRVLPLEKTQLKLAHEHLLFFLPCLLPTWLAHELVPETDLHSEDPQIALFHEYFSFKEGVLGVRDTKNYFSLFFPSYPVPSAASLSTSSSSSYSSMPSSPPILPLPEPVAQDKDPLPDLPATDLLSLLDSFLPPSDSRSFLSAVAPFKAKPGAQQWKFWSFDFWKESNTFFSSNIWMGGVPFTLFEDASRSERFIQREISDRNRELSEFKCQIPTRTYATVNSSTKKALFTVQEELPPERPQCFLSPYALPPPHLIPSTHSYTPELLPPIIPMCEEDDLPPLSNSTSVRSMPESPFRMEWMHPSLQRSSSSFCGETTGTPLKLKTVIEDKIKKSWFGFIVHLGTKATDSRSILIFYDAAPNILSRWTLLSFGDPLETSILAGRATPVQMFRCKTLFDVVKTWSLLLKSIACSISLNFQDCSVSSF